METSAVTIKLKGWNLFQSLGVPSKTLGAAKLPLLGAPPALVPVGHLETVVQGSTGTLTEVERGATWMESEIERQGSLLGGQNGAAPAQSIGPTPGQIKAGAATPAKAASPAKLAEVAKPAKVAKAAKAAKAVKAAKGGLVCKGLKAGGTITVTQGVVTSTPAALSAPVGATCPLVKTGVSAKAPALLGVGKGAAAAGQGTLWTGTGLSLGLGLGMGAWGPVLLVSVLGLVGTGLYLYRRAVTTPEPPDDPNVDDPFAT